MMLSILLFAAVCATGPNHESVVFLGDSITEDGRYLTYLQLFSALKHPGKGIEAYNVGKCGDTADGGLARWAWDDVPERIDRLVVMFGMNDSKRDTLVTQFPADNAEADRRASIVYAYRKNMANLLDHVKSDCREIVVMTPTPHDQYGPQEVVPFMGANEPMLTDFASVIRELGERRGMKVVDLHRIMTQLLKSNPEAGIIGGDRVHPAELGHYLMACICFAETEGAARGERKVVDASGRDSLAFEHLPEALPLPLTEVYRTADRMWPVTERLNCEVLVVTNLPHGNYSLKIDGLPAGRYSDGRLSKGVNLALLDTTNQCLSLQADAVRLRLQRIVADFRSVRYLLKRIEDAGILLSDAQACASFFERNRAEARSLSWGAWHLRCIGKMEEMVPKWKELKAEECALRARLRAIRPVAYRLSIEPLGEESCCQDR